MAQQDFNTSFPNDGLGDKLRDAFLKQQAMNTELYANKVDKVAGWDLSQNNYSDADKAKVDALTGNEEQNVQSDWNELDPTSDAFIIGKPIFSTSEILVSAIWTGIGLNFDVSADAFPINGVSYPATPDVVTLDAAHATLDRIDLIVAIKPTSPDTVGTVGKITGTPASTALVVPPDYDPSIYYVIKQVSVLAAETTPSGAVNTLVFDEGVEWTVTENGNCEINDTDPSTGVNCLEFTSSNNTDNVVFTSPIVLSTEDLDLLQFDLKLKEVVSGKYFIVRLFNNSSLIKSLSFNSFEFPGFDDSNLSYQTISLDKSMINAGISNFNKIQLFLYNAGGTGYFIDNVKIFKGSGAEIVPNTGIPEAPIDGKQYARKNANWIEVANAGSYEPEITTILPSSIPIDGIKVYHISSGVIKPAVTGNVEGKDVEVISNPSDGDSLIIDLSDYPFVQLQGGGFTESPANIYTLQSNEVDGILKQHLTLMIWRRGGLFISNSMNYIPNSEINVLSAMNILNDYVTITFNKIILASDLVIGNFSKVFTQNSDDATNVTLDSITDENGDAISGNTNKIRVYFTVTGISTGLATFTITIDELNDIYGNTALDEVTDDIALINEALIIEEMSNVLAYWKEGEGDNTTGTATKTDVVNGKVLSASGYSNPTLASNKWIFNGINQAFQIKDSAIDAIFNNTNKTGQYHFIGEYNNAASSRIITLTNDAGSLIGRSDLAYKAGSGNIFFSATDNANVPVSQDTSIPISLNTKLLFSVLFHRKDLGSGVVNCVDIYVHNGTTESSYLDINISTIGTTNVNMLGIGIRKITSTNYYQVGFNALVIADSVDYFEQIKNELIGTL